MCELPNLLKFFFLPEGGGEFDVCLYATSQNFENHLLASSCLSVCPSAWNSWAPTKRIFMKFNIWVFFQKSVEKIQVLLKCDKHNGYFTQRPMSIYDNTAFSFS